MLPGEELLSCPFCGGEGEFGYVDDVESPDHGGHFLQCTEAGCGASIGLIYNNGEDPKPLLAERWNRRTTSAGGWVLVPREPTHEMLEGLTARQLFDAGWWFSSGAELACTDATDEHLTECNESDWREWCGFRAAAAEAWASADGVGRAPRPPVIERDSSRDDQSFKSRAEQAEARLAKVEGALEPFAEAASKMDDLPASWAVLLKPFQYSLSRHEVRTSDFRRAREALASEGLGSGEGGKGRDPGTSPSSPNGDPTGWRTMESAPRDGSVVWTFGTLHSDGVGEPAAVQRSWFGAYGWQSDEWGGHEPSFWAPLSSAKPIVGESSRDEPKNPLNPTTEEG